MSPCRVVHEVRSRASAKGKIRGKLAKVRLTGEGLPFKIIVSGINSYPRTPKFLEIVELLCKMRPYVKDDGQLELVIHEEVIVVVHGIAGGTDADRKSVV